MEFASWNLFDVDTNAEAAYQIQQSQGWDAWATYASGAYLAHAADFEGQASSGDRGVTPAGSTAGLPEWLVPAGVVLAALWIADVL